MYRVKKCFNRIFLRIRYEILTSVDVNFHAHDCDELILSQKFQLPTRIKIKIEKLNLKEKKHLANLG